MQKISVILPTIRPTNVQNLIKSFLTSYDGSADDWEFIVIGPYKLPSASQSLWGGKIKIIKDYSSPVICQQKALMSCQGEYVTRAVDDSLYCGNALKEALKLAAPDTVVNMKFTESNKDIDRSHIDCQIPAMAKDEFYHLQYHNQTLMPYVPADFQVINFGIYPKDLLLAVGGWDCQFEGIAVAELDLSIRLQFSGAKVALTPGITLECGWTPGELGDHAPMHHAFFADMEKYKQIYSAPSYADRIKIDPENWTKYPDKWERRF